MTILVKKDDYILLFTKGADDILKSILKKEE